jgi:hypothetical protein
VLAVGSFIVDIVPRWAKEFAIATFGDNDKLFLLASIGVAVVIAAAVAGVLERIRPPLGMLLIGVAGGLAIVAIVTRAGAAPLAFLPTLIGTIAALVLMRILFSRLRSSAEPEPAAGANRRTFLRIAIVAAVGAAVVGTGSRLVNAATSSLARVRDSADAQVALRGRRSRPGVRSSSAHPALSGCRRPGTAQRTGVRAPVPAVRTAGEWSAAFGALSV